MNNRSVKKIDTAKTLYTCVGIVVTALVIAVLLFSFFFVIAEVNGSSMFPTLKDGEKLLVSKISSDYQYGDIVVISKPDSDTPLIKRIIATENQEVYINFNTGEVFVDDVLLDEPYIFQPTNLSGDVKFPVTVPDNSVFVLGDNRNDSNDSRYLDIGMIDVRWIVGKAYLRILPLNKFGILN